MKTCKTVIINLRNTIRRMKLLPRTAISLTLSFLAVLAVAIVCEYFASHSGLSIIAALVGGQVFLYAKELGNLKNGLFKLAADPSSKTVPAAPANQQTPVSKAGRAQKPFEALAKDMGEAFSGDIDYDEEEYYPEYYDEMA